MATNKRRRTSIGNDGCLHLTDLPPESISFISSYLSKPSVALFAAASTASSSSWRKKCNWIVQPSPIISKAILSSEQCWEVLDFVDIEKDLAKRLTDDDLGALLACTDAVHKLKRLHLTGLLRIVGDGLEPLRGSVRIQQIDLCLAKKHDSPWISNNFPSRLPCISETVVIPILTSIIEAEENSLKQVQFPRKWVSGSRGRPIITEFCERFNDLLNSRPFNCSRCIPPESCRWDRHVNVRRPHLIDRYNISGACIGMHYGMQYNTCFVCLENYCPRDGGTSNSSLQCLICRKNYCERCNRTDKCEVCRSERCNECAQFLRCSNCNILACKKDLWKCDCCGDVRCGKPTCLTILSCDGRSCEKMSCNNATCLVTSQMEKCKTCGMEMCPECREKEYNTVFARGQVQKTLKDFCSGCDNLIR